MMKSRAVQIFEEYIQSEKTREHYTYHLQRFVNHYDLESFDLILALKTEDLERENPVFKEMVKIVITPMISSLSILNYINMDSEVEVLGYGISLIVLNVMMYVGIPILAIIKFKNY